MHAACSKCHCPGRIFPVRTPLRLDCESHQSAEASVLAAFGCTHAARHAFLADPGHLA